MSASTEHQKVKLALSAACTRNLFKDEQLETAQKMLARLDAPVRIGVFGGVGSGKSTLVNFLIGETILPARAGLPSIEVAHGDAIALEMTHENGKKSRFSGHDFDLAASYPSVLLRAEAPLPALKRISVLELALPESSEDQKKAVRWAANRTDIVIWTTLYYTSAEHLLWQSMPEASKDHSFLIQTKADEIGDESSRNMSLTDLRQLAEGEFSHLFQIATLDAISARNVNGGVDKQLLRSSGGIDVISAIMRQLDSGRQQLTDQALMFLYQNGVTDLDKLVPPGPDDVPPEEPEVVTPKKPAAKAAAKPKEAKTPAKTEKPAADAPDDNVVPMANGKIEATDPESFERDDLPKEILTRFEAATNHLVQAGRMLLDMDDVEPSAIVSETQEALKKASAELEADDLPQNAALDKMRKTTSDALDLVQLIQTEGSPKAAVDSAGLLLHVQRHFRTESAV